MHSPHVLVKMGGCTKLVDNAMQACMPIVCSAVALQLEGLGFDSRLRVCSLLRVISAHTLGKVGERDFLCGVCMLCPCPLG